MNYELLREWRRAIRRFVRVHVLGFWDESPSIVKQLRDVRRVRP